MLVRRSTISRNPDFAPAMREEHRGNARERARTGCKRSSHSHPRNNLRVAARPAPPAWDRVLSSIQCSRYRVLREAPSEFGQHRPSLGAPTRPVQFLHSLEPLFGGLALITLPCRTGCRGCVVTHPLLGHQAAFRRRLPGCLRRRRRQRTRRHVGGDCRWSRSTLLGLLLPLRTLERLPTGSAWL